MNLVPHLVSIGVFAGFYFTIGAVVDVHWIAMYAGALVLTYIFFSIASFVLGIGIGIAAGDSR